MMQKINKFLKSLFAHHAVKILYLFPMHHSKQVFFLATAMLLSPVCAHALQIAVDSPLTGIRWTLETTFGYQSLQNSVVDKNTMLKKTNIISAVSSASKTQSLIYYSGMLFNAQIEDVTFIKSQLNLGFEKNPRFVWSESADLMQDNNVNELIRCLEYDIQIQLPFTVEYHFIFYPFVGYSFIDYSYNKDNATSLTSMTLYNHYHTIVTGLLYRHSVFRWLSDELFFSFSPFARSDGSNMYVYYFNYGGNVRLSTHPIAIVFFASHRIALFSSQYTFLVADTYEQLNTSEFGISFHMNL